LWQRELTGVRPAVPGFGVRNIDHVVSIDVDAARPTELEPLRDELAVLIENLDAIVLAITDEQPSSRIEDERVRNIEFARAHAFPAPRLDELSVLVELHDSGIAGCRPSSAVSIRDENVAVGSNRDIGRSIELVEAGSRNTGLAEFHQEFSFRAEL